jgi:hypothetical protein
VRPFVYTSCERCDDDVVANLSYANSRHSYAFPRITAMLGDGKTEYDQANDGEANSIGACSVGFNIPFSLDLNEAYGVY